MLVQLVLRQLGLQRSVLTCRGVDGRIWVINKAAPPTTPAARGTFACIVPQEKQHGEAEAVLREMTA